MKTSGVPARDGTQKRRFYGVAITTILLNLPGCAPPPAAESKHPQNRTEPMATSAHVPLPTSAPLVATAATAPDTANTSEANASGADTNATHASATHASATHASAPQPVKLQGLTYHGLRQTQLGFYGVLTPPNYDAPENATRRYPVVVILHGSGSNEVNHGTMADDIGRDDIIYVLPRAPYPSIDQFAEGKEGYTAWPTYPAPWGKYDSPGFPKAEIDKFQVQKQYTQWIADCVRDVISRYRTAPGRAVVVGHSQGGTFAHLFAADHPGLVKAYVSYAGSFRSTLSSPDGKRQIAALRAARVKALLLHREGDAQVDVSSTKQLDLLMTEHKLEHTTQILPGGAHTTDAEVRKLLRAFTREHCCGKDRTMDPMPLNAAGKPVLPPIEDIMTLGPLTCNAQTSGMSACASPSTDPPARCDVFELEPCGNHSFGYRSMSFECVDSRWKRISRAPAQCGVERRDPEFAGCSVELFRTVPSELSKTDACDLALRCGSSRTIVTCDGENDGTGSSLCECTRDDVTVKLPQNVYAGEAPQSCISAAEHCRAVPIAPVTSR